MRYNRLGRTEMNVSAIGLGTVEIGMDYGIKVPEDNAKIDEDLTGQILNKALDYGINLIDTAPSYGNSESQIGNVIGARPCYIATKISMPSKEKNLSNHVRSSIISSLKNLNRNCIDIIQIHNATVDDIRGTEITKTLQKLQKEGLVKFIGASVHGSGNAMAFVQTKCFDVIQIAYNILDQRMLSEVIPEAKKQDIGILARSPYFRGVLTPKSDYLSDEYQLFKNAIDNIMVKLNLRNKDDLAKIAIKFCIATEGVDSILVGTKSLEHLKFAVDAEEEENLLPDIFNQLLKLDIKDNHWLDPRNWPKDREPNDQQ